MERKFKLCVSSLFLLVLFLFCPANAVNSTFILTFFLPVTTGWNDKIVVLKKTTLQLYFKTFIKKADTDLELGACLLHKRRRELCEYSVDGGDQAGFGVAGVMLGMFLTYDQTK